MKSLKLFAFLLIFGSFLTSCIEDECTTEREVFVYNPIYKTKEELKERKVEVLTSRDIINPGKVFYIGTTLLVSETGQGVHVIDNSDKENPTPIAYLKIPGNVDVSYHDGHLIADSYQDILLIDISDVLDPTVTGTIGDVGSNRYHYDEQKDAYIVGYNQEPVTQTLPCNDPFFERDYGYYYRNDYSILSNAEVSFDASGFTPKSGGSIGGQAPGIAGSNSSFAIVGDHFYFIEYDKVQVYNINDKSLPIFNDEFRVAWNIETLFPYGDHLFIGGQEGMYIYDNTDPADPEYISEFVHARACDPVVVQGNTAYVTLSEGTSCRNFTNQLDVIDITNISNPTLIKSYELYKPKGLSIHDDLLVVCDEKAGLKIFDATDKSAIDDNKLSAYQGYTFIEVIYIEARVIMAIGPDGIFQLDISDPETPVLLSRIETGV